jgi:hypothetical protein
MKYKVRSRDYLSRAKQERNANETIRLFYSALELRAGVEARLHEYRDAIRNKRRDNTWQVRTLKREIENVVEKRELPVTINVHDSETGKHYPLRYVPVSDELKSIAERLGDYLHCIPSLKVEHSGFVAELQALVDKGIALLSESVSGELLAPLMFKRNSLTGILIFDEEKAPQSFKDGYKISFEAKFVVVSKSDGGITLKIA